MRKIRSAFRGWLMGFLGVAMFLGMGLGGWVLFADSSLKKLWYQRPASEPAPSVVAYDFSALVEKIQPAVFNLHVTGQRHPQRVPRRYHPYRPTPPSTPTPPTPPEQWEERNYRPQRDGENQFDPTNEENLNAQQDHNHPFNPYLRRWFQHRRQNIPVRSRGSGFLINAEGYALTNYHVVRNAQQIRAHLLDERAFDVKVIGKEPLLDIALIKLEAPAGTRFPFAYLGSSSALKVGEAVLAIGNARGLGSTVTAGIVSAKGRVLRPGRQAYDDFIQTDAAINHGNSGGPLFNRKGEVIGINTAILRDGRGIGFAVPIDVVQRVLPQLYKKGRVDRVKLGVVIQQVTPTLARTFGLERPYGALVNRVVSGSPAQKAGLRSGDVILSFNGAVIKRFNQLPVLVAFNPPGMVAKLEVMRNKQRLILSVTLQPWGKDFEDTTPPTATPDDGAKIPNDSARSLSRLGVGVSDVPAEMRTRWKLTAGVGVLVTHVRTGSPAAENGLRKGDVIVELNRSDVKSINQFVAGLSKTPKGENILLLIRREDSSLYLAFPLP